MKGALLALLLLLVGCTKCPITVRLEKLSGKHLASHTVKSPDPYRCRFFKGQQLVLSWCLKNETPPFRLKLSLIRGSHQLEIIERTLCTKRGTVVFYFLGDDWCKKGDVLTWHADISSEGRLVGSACQTPWVEWIDNRVGCEEE